MTKPVAFSICTCLLALQLSGLHMHADDHGYVGAPETAYTHSHVHHDHRGAAQDHSRQDFEDAHDVSVLDFVAGAFRMPVAILALVFLFAVFPRVGTLASADVSYPVLSGRHTRWRPPLRAPPRTA